MNKNAIKKYAVWARNELITKVTQRAYDYEITRDKPADPHADIIAGRPLTPAEKDQRRQLISRIHTKGFDPVMEEVAYTWFNRFIALRFMEVNEYLPSRVRVFTNETGAFAPAIMAEALTLELEGLDREKVIAHLEEGNSEALYKYLLLTQCNALHSALPQMFQPIDHDTELLFPTNLLKPDSVVARLVSDIPEEDWKEAVEIIGWLYQFYNIEPKARVDAYNGKKRVPKEDIPAKTQLFTPDWIVRYMVENSLGKLWLERHPQDPVKNNWAYYLEEAEQEPEVRKQLAEIQEQRKQTRLEEIKLLDPAMGSGHILVYAFEVLMQLYESSGYSQRDAAVSIITNNLYGLDIDDRAYQLAYFSLMMKGRKYDRRFLTREITPQVYAIQESNGMERFRTGEGQMSLEDTHIETANYLIKVFEDAKEFGSILDIEQRDYAGLLKQIKAYQTEVAEDIEKMVRAKQVSDQMPALIHQAMILAQQYDVTITNPPYFSSADMAPKLSEYVKKHYPNSKSDLFAVFIEKCLKLSKKTGFASLITMHSWMFLSSYEKLRGELNQSSLDSMVHLGARAFEEISGEVVQTTTFVFRKKRIDEYEAPFVRLVDEKSEEGKRVVFLERVERGLLHTSKQTNFEKIPGMPLAYWATEEILKAFNDGEMIGDYTQVRIGMGTGKNDLFVREWWETDYYKIDLSLTSVDELDTSSGRFFPYNKGGEYRLWYGNLQQILWFDKSGRKKMKSMSGHRENGGYNWYFKKGITWSFISSSRFGVRMLPYGFAFDVAGSTLFPEEDDLNYTLGFLSSVVCQKMLSLLNPTLNYQAGNIRSLPVIFKNRRYIEELVQQNIEYSRDEWDSFETSWDFKKHPLI